jgi:hypothetical protein
MRRNGFTDCNISTDFLEPAAVPSAGGAVSQVFDISGMKAPVIIMHVGDEAGGDTLSGTNKYTVTALESDATDGTYANVTQVNADAAIDFSSGVLTTIIAAAGANKTYSFGYFGSLDFVKLVITPAGTLATGCIIGATCIDIEPQALPHTNT